MSGSIAETAAFLIDVNTSADTGEHDESNEIMIESRKIDLEKVNIMLSLYFVKFVLYRNPSHVVSTRFPSHK